MKGKSVKRVRKTTAEIKMEAFNAGVSKGCDMADFNHRNNRSVQVFNARQDIVKALSEIGIANSKIAYSLMRALEFSK